MSSAEVRGVVSLEPRIESARDAARGTKLDGESEGGERESRAEQSPEKARSDLAARLPTQYPPQVELVSRPRCPFTSSELMNC